MFKRYMSDELPSYGLVSLGKDHAKIGLGVWSCDSSFVRGARQRDAPQGGRRLLRLFETRPDMSAEATLGNLKHTLAPALKPLDKTPPRFEPCDHGETVSAAAVCPLDGGRYDLWRVRLRDGSPQPLTRHYVAVSAPPPRMVPDLHAEVQNAWKSLGDKCKKEGAKAHFLALLDLHADAERGRVISWVSSWRDTTPVEFPEAGVVLLACVESATSPHVVEVQMASLPAVAVTFHIDRFPGSTTLIIPHVPKVVTDHNMEVSAEALKQKLLTLRKSPDGAVTYEPLQRGDVAMTVSVPQTNEQDLQNLLRRVQGTRVVLGRMLLPSQLYSDEGTLVQMHTNANFCAARLDGRALSLRFGTGSTPPEAVALNHAPGKMAEVTDKQRREVGFTSTVAMGGARSTKGDVKLKFFS